MGHSLIRRDGDEVRDTRPKLRRVTSELFKLFGGALFLFAVAALFWQWAIFAAFGAMVAVAGLWFAEVALRRRTPDG
jgi:hypothetical protein